MRVILQNRNKGRTIVKILGIFGAGMIIDQGEFSTFKEFKNGLF